MEEAANSKENIRKGPWKPEEDQVLLTHVHKYGPRDWSSIRSKGLLQRTGKSCRLRWVNKLRPNLKNGCKFTADEERVVIELQAQLGNKWATIATHLPGRTDNDVKNFWSSRQKRLARILHSKSPTSFHNRSLHKSCSSSNSSTSCSTKRPRTISLQAPKISTLMEGEASSKTQRCSSVSAFTGTSSCSGLRMIPFSGLVNPSSLEFDANDIAEPVIPLNSYPYSDELQPDLEVCFPSIPHLQTDLTFPVETQELIDRLDSGFLEPFGCSDEPELLENEPRFMSCFGGGEVRDQTGGRGAANDNPIAPDSFFDDFPSDMFDEIEPLPSPSRW